MHKLRHLWSDKSPSESLWSTKAFAAAAAASLIASAAGFSAFPIGAATHVWAARIAAVLALSGVHRRKLCTKDKGFVMALFACSELVRAAQPARPRCTALETPCPALLRTTPVAGSTLGWHVHRPHALEQCLLASKHGTSLALCLAACRCRWHRRCSLGPQVAAVASPVAASVLGRLCSAGCWD